MKSITVHNMEDPLSNKLDQLSITSGKSKNKIIKDILRRALGLGKEKKGQIDLSMVIGSIEVSEADRILENIKVFDDTDIAEW